MDNIEDVKFEVINDLERRVVGVEPSKDFQNDEVVIMQVEGVDDVLCSWELGLPTEVRQPFPGGPVLALGPIQQWGD